MDPEPIVFDISSDEESNGRIDEPKGVDFDWIAEFLGVSGDGENFSDDGDSDEVVVLGEVKGSAKSKPTKQTVRNENDDDDDDCVVLDGDPDKPVVDDSNSKGDSEELLIVAEKGQVACRDFPHPRHLCVSFLFSTTPHEKYCSLCHCYVCDKPAPCVLWATTSSAVDHCHATEREEKWKTQRRNLKSGIIASLKPPPPPLPLPPPPPPPPAIKLPEALLTPTELPRFSPVPRPPQNHVPRPSTVQGCSSANFSVPTILSRSRTPQSGIALPNRFQPRVSPAGPRFVPNNNIAQRPKPPGQPVVNSGHRFVPQNPAPFKRPAIYRPPRTGSVGVSSPVNHWTYNSPAIRNHAVPGQYPPRNPSPAMTWQNVNPGAHQIPPRPNAGPAGLSPALPPQQQFAGQISPPSVGNQNFYRPGSQFHNGGQSMFLHGTEPPSAGQIPTPAVAHSEGPRTAGLTDYDPSWVSNAVNNAIGQSNRQQPSLVDHLQLQVTEPSNGPPTADPNSQVSSANSSNLNSVIDDWLLEDPSVPMAQDDSSIPQLNNIYSPEPSSIDLGSFFDFETPWNSLTQA